MSNSKNMGKFFKSKIPQKIIWQSKEVMIGVDLGFRNQSPIQTRIVNFSLVNGGIGDFINWCAALIFIAEKYPFVDGWLFVTPPFLAVAEHLFKPFPNWKCMDRKKFMDYYVSGTGVIAPLPPQAVTAIGTHLIDLGFHYFVQTDVVPKEYNFIPRLKFDTPLTKFADVLPEKYCVITSGATADSRAMPASGFNELADFCIGKGLTPVFLGKREVNDKYVAKFDDQYQFEKGIDLREKTTLLEATQIMEGARFVLGVDNGLLHMASCTPVPIIFGYSVASPQHRRPRRKVGLTYDVTVNRDKLGCIHCQSNTRFLPGHSYKTCYYGDRKCLELLFENGGEQWKKAINQVLLQG